MSILNAAKGEMAETKKKAAKSSIKELLTELEKARAVETGIKEKIINVLVDAGENAEEVEKLLAEV